MAERFPIQIAPDTIALLQLFHRPSCHLEDLCVFPDCIKMEEERLKIPETAAKQFISQLEDHWTPAFLMALRDEIDKELLEHDKQYGTKFSKIPVKKAIEILEQHIRSYQSMIELYEAQPHNQAITEYSAKEAEKNIIELRAAVAVLKNFVAPAEGHDEQKSSN